MMESSRDESHFQFLSELVLRDSDTLAASQPVIENIRNISQSELEAVAALAAKNHVVVRAFTRLIELLGREAEVARWAELALEQENARIGHALRLLAEICGTLERNGCPVIVIKSLDHWPDLGSDLDLYTDADAKSVVNVMRSHFNARLEERSWGDHLANKWNFAVPGLPELVEVHVGRLGQTGEQTAVARAMVARTCTCEVNGHSFRVLSPEGRIVISTLQRMYRHFYIRLCDVIDIAGPVEAKRVDFARLHEFGSAAGLWEGIATYLNIISGYVAAYRGSGITLPSLVTGSAKFGIDRVKFRRDFLRVPILPHSLDLYAGELKTLILGGQVRNSLRLSLLPGLATAAALEMKLTGSDKGIW